MRTDIIQNYPIEMPRALKGIPTLRRHTQALRAGSQNRKMPGDEGPEILDPNKMEAHWGNIGITEGKMETTGIIVEVGEINAGPKQ